MRDELKQISLSLGDLSEFDLSRTLHIARKLHSGRFELIRRDQQVAAKETKTEEEYMTYADDIAWYAHEESFFIWHFCLWRLQAILEGIIMNRFLTSEDNKRVLGLKSKLDALRRAGYKINEVDYDELLRWAKIRNHLSHFPPSSHAPGPLQETDIVEYHDLCMKLYGNWNEQNRSRSNPPINPTE